MKKYDFTDSQINKMVDNLGGHAAALKVMSGKVTVTFHEGPVFRSYGTIIISPTEKIDVTFVTGHQLGQVQAATRDVVFAKAVEAGLLQCRDQVLMALSGTWDYRMIHVGALMPSDDSDGTVIRLAEICRSEVFSEDIEDPHHLFDPDDVWVFELPAIT